MDEYPQVGDRIRLIEMPYDPSPILSGTEGTVTSVTVFPDPIPSSYSEWEGGRAVRTQIPAPNITAQVEVDWDIPSSLSLLLPGDRFEILEAAQ